MKQWFKDGGYMICILLAYALFWIGRGAWHDDQYRKQIDSLNEIVAHQDQSIDYLLEQDSIAHPLNWGKPSKISQREYQFDVDQQGFYIYTPEDRYLGFVPWRESNTLDSLIITDNQ